MTSFKTASGKVKMMWFYTVDVGGDEGPAYCCAMCRVESDVVVGPADGGQALVVRDRAEGDVSCGVRCVRCRKGFTELKAEARYTGEVVRQARQDSHRAVGNRAVAMAQAAGEANQVRQLAAAGKQLARYDTPVNDYRVSLNELLAMGPLPLPG